MAKSFIDSELGTIALIVGGAYVAYNLTGSVGKAIENVGSGLNTGISGIGTGIGGGVANIGTGIKDIGTGLGQGLAYTGAGIYQVGSGGGSLLAGSSPTNILESIGSTITGKSPSYLEVAPVAVPVINSPTAQPQKTPQTTTSTSKVSPTQKNQSSIVVPQQYYSPTPTMPQATIKLNSPSNSISNSTSYNLLSGVAQAGKILLSSNPVTLGQSLSNYVYNKVSSWF